MLADFLFGSLRTRVLSALLLHPETSWHVRELARRLDTLPGSLNRELVRLAEAGILARQRIGNQVHYRADRNCPIFSELAALLRKTSGLAAVLADALYPLGDRIQSALIFGSVASGREHAQSDVDVLVLGNADFADVLEALHPIQAQILREINPVVYRPEDFRAKLAANNTWAREVVEHPKLFLIGGADDFAKLAGDRQSQPV